MLATGQLLLDWHNPRLRSEDQLGDEDEPDSTERQRALAVLMAKEYHPFRIAESISRHQYFLSEPMIAVRHGEKYRVIEGNRRLTALLGLQHDSLREEFTKENKGWRGLPTLDPDALFPVLIVEDARSIAPLLGYRHIAGIEPWGAYAQARYIVGLVEDGNSLVDVAELVGKTPTAVRSMYRDHEILEQGSKMFRLETSRARQKFGVFNAAMGNRGIRDHIGGPAPRHVDAEHWPLPDDRKQELEEVLGWIFGSKTESPLLTDSRQLGALSRVLADSSGRGLEVLRRGGTLNQAEAAITDPDEQFARAVDNAHSQIRATRPPQAGADLPQPTVELLLALRDLVEEILTQPRIERSE